MEAGGLLLEPPEPPVPTELELAMELLEPPPEPPVPTELELAMELLEPPPVN